MHKSIRLLSLGVALLAAPAAAQSGDRVAADALFQAARLDFDRGDFASACAKFEESNRLDPAPGTLLNLALCLEKAGLVASAWQRYRQASEVLRDDRLAFATARAEAVEQRLPRLVVVLRDNVPAEARVFRNRVELKRASLAVPLPVDPGIHVIVVKAPGRRDAQFQVEMKEGQTREVLAAVGPVATPTRSDAAVAAAAQSPSSWPQVGSSSWLWILGGIGVVGVTTSLVTGGLAMSKLQVVQDHCVDKRCDQEGLDAASAGSTFATVSTVTGVAGVVALGAGAYLLLSHDEQGRESTVVHAALRPDGGFVGVSGRF
ncbi:MAG: hypothetical protein MUF54_08360 [Polyangiaceae bacterium]|jgi:hypothetical protein|nr:hypothetical protein [Polyangiaceae bacterium]